PRRAADDGGRHGAPLPHRARRRPEGRHEGHVRRHLRGAPRPRVPLDGGARRGPRARVGVDPGALVKRAALLVLGAALGGCAHSGVDTASLSSSSDAIVWEAAQKAYQKKQWENARQYYKRIVDGFPNSEYGPGSRLGLGQSYFEEGGTGNYVLAVAA